MDSQKTNDTKDKDQKTGSQSNKRVDIKSKKRRNDDSNRKSDSKNEKDTDRTGTRNK